MVWVVDSETAYEEFDWKTDPVEESDLRLAVLQGIKDWQSFGPPDAAVWDENFRVFVCDVPGTPVIAEYIEVRSAVPPQMIVKRFLWSEPYD